MSLAAVVLVASLSPMDPSGHRNWLAEMSPPEQAAVCGQDSIEDIVAGTTRQAIGGGFVAAGILTIVGAAVALILYSDSTTPALVSGGIGAAITLVGGLTISSGRTTQREGLRVVCPSLSRAPASERSPEQTAKKLGLQICTGDSDCAADKKCFGGYCLPRQD